MKYCPDCGAPLSEGMKFCTECGTKIVVPEPVQEPPVAPVEVPPAPPVYEAPAYEPPVQEPPAAPAPEAPAYTPFRDAGDGKPAARPKEPKKPREKKPVNKIAVLFGVIGVLVILLVVLLVALLGGGSDEAADVWGVYEGVSCTVDGGKVSADGDWIELQKKGKAKICIMDSEFSGKWSLDGETLELTQSGDTYRGTLKGGVLSIELAGASYVFAKEGEAVEPVTYKAVTCISHGQILDEELMDLIGGCYIRFNGDGTGTFYCFGDKVPMTYDDKSLTIESDVMSYTLDGDTMEFEYADGSVFTLELTQEDPEEVAAAEPDGETEEWEEQEEQEELDRPATDPFLPTELDWIGAPVSELNLDSMTLTFGSYGYSGTAWLEEDVNGDVVVGNVSLYLYDMDYSEVRDMLIERYGEPTDEGEEPYVESNGGAVLYSWFEYSGGTVHLTSGSEQDFLQITVEMDYG